MEILIWADTVATLLIAVALLMHIRKEVLDAHGTTRT
jgi:hypothetical protein